MGANAQDHKRRRRPPPRRRRPPSHRMRPRWTSLKFGEYVQTGEGRPVYLFTTDTQGTGDQEPQISCTSEECLKAWPLVTTSGEPQAGEGADEALLGTTDYEGQTVVTYNGWPLYYFTRDEGADAPQGQEIESFGGKWYLATPSGEEVHAQG